MLFACIFIPRIHVGGIATFYRMDLRLEDLLLALVIILVLGVKKSPAFFPEIPKVEKAFLIFLVTCQISIFSGIFFKTVDKPLMSLLYLIKWFEYFLVFIMTLRLTSGPKEKRFFLWAFFGLGMAVSLYGYAEYFFPFSKAVYPNYYRLFERAPFHGDANHIGGFLSLWIAFFTGLFLSTQDKTRKWLFFAAIIFAFFPLIWTYSRKSYFALAGGALVPAAILPVNRRRAVFLICILGLLGLLFPTRLSERLLDLNETFSSVDPFHSSWAGGLHVWKESLWNFERFWMFGSGLGSRHRLFYESQYVLILAETGIVGFAAFSYLCFSLIKEAWRQFFKGVNHNHGMLGGWFLGFLVMMIHSVSCVSWTVSKIAIPFWFWTAFIFASDASQRQKVSPR